MHFYSFFFYPVRKTKESVVQMNGKFAARVSNRTPLPTINTTMDIMAK